MCLYRQVNYEVGDVSFFWVDQQLSMFISQRFVTRQEAIEAAFADSLEWNKSEFICELDVDVKGVE